MASTTSYQYDDLHRLTRVERSDGTITLYEYDALGNRIKKSVVSNTTLSAQFTANPTEGLLPLDVAFTDQSTGDITSWLWDFGDGDTSTQQNPVHTYQVYGSYTAQVTVTDINGLTGTNSLEIDVFDTKNQEIVVLTPTSPDTTIRADSTALVYGTGEANSITLESGAVAELINFPGNNLVTIQSESNLFTVFRSGGTVTFEGTDGTVLRIPATTTSQSIVFNDGTYSLIIDSNRVMLGDQEINLTPAVILPVSPDDVITNTLGMTFVQIQPGTFMMGSPEDELGRNPIIETQHQVTLTQGYYMQTTEMTQGQWKAVMGSNPSYYSSCGDECPVEYVSWNDVQEFIIKMNQRGEGTYALPTEAQWEYAARAGSTTAFANGDITETLCGYDPNLDSIGWYCYNSDSKPHMVAQKTPNAWGLYDMHGNVWEWCQDWYGSYNSESVIDPSGPLSGDFRVTRGGSWYNNAQNCRSAYRYITLPSDYATSLGFRLVFSPGQQ